MALTHLVRRFFARTEAVQTASMPRTVYESESLISNIEAYRELLLAEKYAEADSKMRAQQKSLSLAVKRAIMSSLTSEILIPRQLEWTNHGMRRTFRFYGLSEKRRYLRQANDLLAVIRKETSNICYGFGAVLGMARQGDLVPHDDDLDFILGFTLDEARSFADAKTLARAMLEPAGFTLHGNHLSHFNVTGPIPGAAVDLFLGFIEGDKVSWFPSHRKSLNTSDVFPSLNVKFLDIPCEFPANPEKYLEGTYGEGWQQPISNWMHPWDASEFSDFLPK